MKLSEHFWSASLEDMQKGWCLDGQEYLCLICGHRTEQGVIYPIGERFLDARKSMEEHIAKAHGSVFAAVCAQDKKVTGLTQQQNKLLRLLYENKNDREMQKELGVGSISTVRNHRFALREREREAKVLLLLMALVRERNPLGPKASAMAGDDRHKTTVTEEEKILARLFPRGLDGPLSTFQIREKSKVVVLRAIVNRLELGREYTEREVNDLLRQAYEEDYVTLRRYLIEYGLLKRTKDCSRYWRPQPVDEQAEDAKRES